MVGLVKAISQIEKKKVLVAGDLMLDTYTIGKARRISPEAPVAVVHVQKEEHRPGGAGNVILNLVSLGIEVVALGRVGTDKTGQVLKNCLQSEGVELRGVVEQAGYLTPIKNRIIAENQQIVRIDHEDTTVLPQEYENRINNLLPMLLDEVSLIAISDYGKGLLTYSLLSTLINQARQRNIPVIVDPKGLDYSKYKGASVIKPNQSEAYLAANLPQDASLASVAEKILKETFAENLMITRSEAGISVFNKTGRRDFPVSIHEVKDVTGAGDTVLAALACALANGIALDQAAELCNIAAGLAIERFGCARITLAELARRLLDVSVENKIFDEDHLFALKEVIHGKRWSLIGVSTDHGISTHLFSSLKKCRQEHDILIVYVKDDTDNKDFINFLASLREIDFIILKSGSFEQFLDEMSPQNVYLIEKDGLVKIENLFIR